MFQLTTNFQECGDVTGILILAAFQCYILEGIVFV